MDPVLVRRVKEVPGRSFDSFFDYSALDDAPDHEVYGKESGLSNVVNVNTDCVYNATPSFFFERYTSMGAALTAESDGLGMDWLYLHVACPSPYLRTQEDAGKVEEGSADVASGRLFPTSGWKNATGTTNYDHSVWLLAVVQFFAVYKVEKRGDSSIRVRYWVGVTLHPSVYPDPLDRFNPGDDWNDDDALDSVLEQLWDSGGDRAEAGERLQQFMSCVTDVRARLITGRVASKNYGYPGNTREYPAGMDSAFGKASSLSEWTRTAFPYLMWTAAGKPAGTPYYQAQFGANGEYEVGPAAMQTTAGAEAGNPGRAVSYLGNMMTGVAKMGLQSEWTEATEAQLVARGFECLFGEAVLCSLRLGYIPSSEPGRSSPLHVKARRRLTSGDLVKLRDFRTAMAGLKARGAEADYVYAFGDADSVG